VQPDTEPLLDPELPSFDPEPPLELELLLDPGPLLEPELVLDLGRCCSGRPS
jgi:hypothetical protein